MIIIRRHRYFSKYHGSDDPWPGMYPHEVAKARAAHLVALQMVFGKEHVRQVDLLFVSYCSNSIR